MNFPIIRPRRLRESKLVRDALAEITINIEDLIVPIFVKEDIKNSEPIPAMPGYYRYSIEKMIEHVKYLTELGLKKILLFGIPKNKDLTATSAYKRNGVVQRAIRELRNELGDSIIIITDICMCQYTTHGHCGVVVKENMGWGERVYIDNDRSIEIMGKIALSHAEAGADIVAPSSMMDGVVKAIRKVLDDNGFTNISIMSYSIKYASAFYGPFREAAYSAPEFGDRRSYQMDPRNRTEALKEAYLDVDEGADILMVKPALAYLDIIKLIKTEFPGFPIAAYNVSGEYSMVKAASEKGWIDEKLVVLEIMTAIKRAGANLIISYHSIDVAKWIKEGLNPF